MAEAFCFDCLYERCGVSDDLIDLQTQWFLQVCQRDEEICHSLHRKSKVVRGKREEIGELAFVLWYPDSKVEAVTSGVSLVMWAAPNM